MKRLAILRGKPTAGKSTAYVSLKKRKEMKGFVFIDHCALKDKFGKEKGKQILFEQLKESFPSGKDIIIEEMSEKTLKKNINYSIKKYKYKIITFQFEVTKDEAYKRDIKRAEDKWHPFMGKEWVDKLHKMHEERFDKKAILVDCDKLNKKQVVDFIIKKLK